MPKSLLPAVFPLALLFTLAAADGSLAAEMRIVGPKVLSAGVPSLVRVEQREGNEWRLADPDKFEATIGQGAELLEDPAAVTMNPLTVVADAEAKQVKITATGSGEQASVTMRVGEPKVGGRVSIAIDGNRRLHKFDGFGGGVLFYDNQWELSRGDEIWDWCFKDVRTTFLHILARPKYEPENDNDDWRTLDESRMDFSASKRAINVAKRALAKDPDLKIYLSLYSPPAWMKTNESTRGNGGLKAGLAYRQEFAEYFYAYLKHLKAEGVTVDYLAFFNEPDWPHGQDGMHIPDMGELVDIFDQTAASLEELIATDDQLAMPVLVFPDSLGAGGITRSKKNRPKLLARAPMLAQRVGVWGVHDYWNQGGYWPVRFKELRKFPPVGDKPIWMTEWAQRYRLGDLESANEYGANILNAVRLGAQAWMVFEWCHPSENQSGLISCDWGAKPPRQRYWRSKAYYVFQQLANNTPAGAWVVSSRATSPTGLIDPRGDGSQTLEHLALTADGKLILHAHNRGGDPVRLDARVKGVTEADGLVAIVTGPTGNSLPFDGIESSKAACKSVKLRGVLPANSLLTVTLPVAD